MAAAGCAQQQLFPEARGECSLRWPGGPGSRPGFGVTPRRLVHLGGSARGCVARGRAGLRPPVPCHACDSGARAVTATTQVTPRHSLHDLGVAWSPQTAGPAGILARSGALASGPGSQHSACALPPARMGHHSAVQADCAAADGTARPQTGQRTARLVGQLATSLSCRAWGYAAIALMRKDCVPSSVMILR
jgi:hypothetical protein